MSRPLYPIEGVVSWNMNTTCNYRCSYCTQRFVDDRGQWARDLPRFIEFFRRLPGDWEIKLSGGEPFNHPNFLEAVRELAESGRRVSVVTNLSASKATLEAYCQAVAARPGVISASLHLEYVSSAEFRDKCVWLQSIHAGSVCVTNVATRANLPQLQAMAEEFAAAGLVFKIQPEKQDREVIDYAPHERDLLLSLGGHAGTGEISPSFQGQLCWAGARYFIVDHQGEAHRCYPARRMRTERLGNVLEDGFRLELEPKPCPYHYCNCVVPQERGMVSAKELRCSPGA